MDEQQSQALANEQAKTSTLQTPEDLSQFDRLLKTMSAEAALNAGMNYIFVRLEAELPVSSMTDGWCCGRSPVPLTELLSRELLSGPCMLRRRPCAFWIPGKAVNPVPAI